MWSDSLHLCGRLGRERTEETVVFSNQNTNEVFSGFRGVWHEMCRPIGAGRRIGFSHPEDPVMLRSPALSAGPWNARRRNPVARGAAILGVAFVLCCSPVPPAATLIDFNTPGQLTTLFATPDTTNLDSQVAGVGFDGTGGAEQPAAVNAQYWTLRTSFGGADPMWQTELLWNSGGISLPVYGSIGMMAEPLAFPRSVAQRPSTVENDSGTANRIPFTGFHFGTGTFDLIAYDPIVGDQRIQGIPDEEGLFPAVPEPATARAVSRGGKSEARVSRTPGRVPLLGVSTVAWQSSDPSRRTSSASGSTSGR